ncbi:MAG: hypothetical protein WCR17_04550 [Candidatus Methanomethylophilaceae archaeon]
MEKVKPGDNLNIKAQDWNKIADVVNSQSLRTGGGIAGNTSNQYILISNTTAVAISMYGIVELDGLAIDPVVQANTYQVPVFEAILPIAEHDSGHTTYAIAQEPIAPGTVGKACINGVSLVFVAGYYVEDYHFIKPSFSGWHGMFSYGKTQMKLLAKSSAYGYFVTHITPDVSDSVVPAIIDDNIDGYGYYTVDLYENGFGNSSTGQASMYLPEGAYGITAHTGMRTYVYRQSHRTINAEIISEGEGEE